MARRKTVKANCARVSALLKEKDLSNAAFSRRIGKYNSWYGEVLRGHNLPSPEEAARMCELLHTTPEDILIDAEDVTLVRGLLEQAEKNNAPAPIAEGERMDPTTARIIEIVRQLDPKVRESYLQQLESLLALQDAAQKRDSQG